MREKIFTTTAAILFALLFAGIFYTQILRYNYYHKLSRDNSIRIIPIDGPRGNMFDRTGRLVVTNRMSFDVAIVYQEVRERFKLADVLTDILGMSRAEVAAALQKAGRTPYAPVTIAEDVEKDKAIALEEGSFYANGLVVEAKSKRSYPFGEAGSHVFGYLGQISGDEFEALRDYGYRMRDLVGRGGLEKYYDTYLRGVDGGLQIEVDSRGQHTRVLGMKEPVGGKDLHLTIDMPLQLLCDKLLGERRGAVIAMNPKNGELLALASHPGFDPNIFIKPRVSEKRLKLLKDNIGRPMLNKAITGIYPPGSVFKIVTSAAVLEGKKISPGTRLICGGSYKLGDTKFDCWKAEGHGSQTISEGLMNSCNVFFYQSGRLAGADMLEAYAKIFGYGRPSGIDLPDEASGIAPGKAWKRIYRNESWYEGETLNYSIGQGYLAVTPIQVLNMMAIVANKGSLVRPHFVKAIGASSISGPRQRNAGIKNETLRIIREGMFKVVNDENGTGKYAKVEGISIAGKTGTAQNPQGLTHAWFGGFAPFEDPKVCIVVFLEHGGKGGLESAQMAAVLFQEAKKRGYL